MLLRSATSRLRVPATQSLTAVNWKFQDVAGDVQQLAQLQATTGSQFSSLCLAHGAALEPAAALQHDALSSSSNSRCSPATPWQLQPAAGFSSTATAASTEAAAAVALPEAIASATEGPALRYREGLDSGLYRPDPLQQITVEKLQRVYQDLRTAYPAPPRQSGLTMVDSVGAQKEQESSWFSWSSLIKSGLQDTSAASGQRQSIKGLYMYGGVGCGKTMLMDLLVASAPREFKVQRTHFHDFMLDIHRRLRSTTGEADPLKHVADDVAEGVKVLALDELFVTDVADAMILHRLFGRLWESGLVLVATSNRAPDSLYENGLQRQLFLPFIAKLKETCVIHNMNSPVDYRRLAHHTRGIYFLTPDRTALLHAAFLDAGQDSLCPGASSSSGDAGAAGGLGNPGPRSVQVAMGRQLTIPQALGSAAMFEFDDLCNRPLAAADYIALAENFSTVALADVPLFGFKNINAAYRFVTLVDVLYEHRVRLLISAEGTPFELFERVLSPQEAQKAAGSTHGHMRLSSSDGSSLHGQSSMQLQHSFSSSSGSPTTGPDIAIDAQLAFVKDRAISRLTEMQSIEYQIQYAREHAPQLVLALQEMQEQQRQHQ